MHWRDPMDRPCSCVLRMLENQGFRELACAEILSAGVRFAPSIDEKQVFARHALEELEHFETVAAIYEDLLGENLLDVVRPRLDKVPHPSSWAELVIAALLFDRANFHQLRVHRSANDPLVARTAERLLRDEPDHLAASEAALAELGRSSPSSLGQVQYHLATWLSIAQRAFDDASVHAADCGRAPHLPVDAMDNAVTEFLSSLPTAITQ
jgi:1,2-phenylacetyl-CoA epoxidase catalytic subunit